jgi:LPS export ABC transporter protein LptC
MKRKKVLIPALLLAAVLCAVLFILWQGRQIPGKVLTVFSERADVVVRDFRLSQVDGSGIRWTVTADSARYLSIRNRVTLENVRVRMIDRERSFSVSAREGNVDTEKRNMDLYGAVLLTSDTGERCETGELHYDHAAGRITAPGPCLIKNDAMEIEGTGVTVFLESRRFVMGASVRARIAGGGLSPAGG